MTKLAIQTHQLTQYYVNLQLSKLL